VSRQRYTTSETRTAAANRIRGCGRDTSETGVMAGSWRGGIIDFLIWVRRVRFMSPFFLFYSFFD
jgi:hypothetical protein